MSDDRMAADAAHARRAAAVLTHYLCRDTAGLHAVINELQDADDVAGIIIATADLVEKMLPRMLQPTAVDELRAMLARFADMEHRG